MAVTFVPTQLSQATKTSPQLAFPSVGIAGSGTAMMAMACYLAGRGYPVEVLARDEYGDSSNGASSVKAEGAIKGQFDRTTLGIKPDTLLQNCSHLFIVAESSMYKEIAWSLSPWLKARHLVILYGGGIGASLEFENLLLANGVSGAQVVEIDPLFHCRKENSATIKVDAMRQWGQYSGTSPSSTFECESALKRLLPKLDSAQNFLSRGLSDYQSLLYPINYTFGADAEMGAALLELINASSEKEDTVLNHLEREFNMIAEAYSTSQMSTVVNIRRMYGAITSSIADAVSMAPLQPASWDHMIKNLTESVSTSYVPLHELARLAHLTTPAIDSVISMSAVMCGVDLLSQGRTLNRLGLEGLSQREIVKILNG